MPPRLKRRLAAAIALGMGGVIAIGLLEIGLRIHNPIHVPLRAYDIALPVNQVFTARIEGAKKQDADIVVHHNSLGLRGPEKPDDFEAARTLVTVGGSTTACVGLTEAHAWPEILATLLEPKDPTLWLNNAGVNGHSTFGHTMLLRQMLRHLKPDYALFLIGINDVGRGDLNRFDGRVDPSKAVGVTSIIRGSELLSTLQVIWRSLRAYDLGLARSGEIDFHALGEQAYDEAEAARQIEEHRREYLPRYDARVRTLVRESRAAGIEPILLTQPAVYGDGRDPETGRDLAKLDVDGVSGRLKWQLLELYNDATRRIAREESVLLIDTARLLPKDSRLFTDFIHYSAAGAREMAEIVARAIEKAIL